VAARTLYDAGRIVSSSPSLAKLASGVALVLHPSDLERVGVSEEGDDVLVTSARGTVRLPVQADAATAPGTAFMAFAQKGDVGPNDLVDIKAAVTELRVETTR
jgi:formate dehydrogenase major subunit